MEATPSATSSKKQDLFLLKKSLDPGAFADLLRRLGPISYWPKERIFVVSDAVIAKQALRDPELSADRGAFFASRLQHLNGNPLEEFFAVANRFMVMRDGQEHLQRRKLAAQAFSDELVDRFAGVVENTIEKLLQVRGNTTSFDLVTTLARDLPSLVLADLFQIPQRERASFLEWANTMTEFFGTADACDEARAARVNQAAHQIKAYFQRMIEARRSAPEDDFMGRMVSKQNEFALLDADIVSQAALMFVAGSVTTTDQICNNVFTLLSNEGAYQKLRNDPLLIPNAIEELNRLDPAVSFLFRVAKSAIHLGGTKIPAGAPVFISLHAINRDPTLFPQPNECQLERNSNPHFSFGHGSHYCLGARLGRLQMVSVLRAFLRFFPNLKLDPADPPLRDHYSIAFSGFRRLPLRV